MVARSAVLQAAIAKGVIERTLNASIARVAIVLSGIAKECATNYRRLF